mmetsp:Transcript_57738/g.135533  ORF Transcript_57738/g.135533 Transcript_57738/m.135533 type:complete len:214 (+) Transcript_57738:182-823(+)
MESIGESNITIGIVAKGGIVIATEKKETKNPFGENFNSEKTFIIDNHIICAASGAIPDSQILIEHARIQAQQYKKIYQDYIPVKKIVEIICDIKQQFTHKGGQRPFGVSFLVAGWDSSNGLQLFRTDSSGTFSGWKAAAIGSNSIINQSILTDEYKNDLDLNQALSVLVKILYKKTNSLEFWKIIDIVLLVLDDKQQILIRKMNREEVNSLVS